jgi:formate dehydrogenase maturation protein FdhE
VRDLRLGDIIDDWCVKCRRLTNHAIVSLLDTEAAKVRCRSCYSDHNYLKEIAPPSKKELKRLAEAALSGEPDVIMPPPPPPPPKSARIARKRA